jgi:aryl-alcohol dehydrogenase-like predicted oxidoreductase
VEYRYLGKSGLKLSAIGLGTMSFGWEADEATSLRMLSRYAEEGGNTLDTADIYAEGDAERIIGRWLREQARDDFVVATKVRYATSEGPNHIGLSRKHIMEAVEASLRRLQTDYIDLYQVHCWDSGTPLEETLTTLDALVKSGKVRYLGNMTGWQLQKALDISRYLGLETFVSLQALYNLLDRYLEWDLLPVCRNEGLGLLCWSPLGGGWLTGAIRPGMTGPPENSRIQAAEKGGWSESWTNYNTDHTWTVLETLLTIAEEVGKSPAQVALNWLARRPDVTCPIVGATTVDQLVDNLESITWSLSQDQINRLNTVSEQVPPRYPYRFIDRFIR